MNSTEFHSTTLFYPDINILFVMFFIIILILFIVVVFFYFKYLCQKENESEHIKQNPKYLGQIYTTTNVDV